MKITREQAREIAWDAMKNAGWDMTDYVGYYQIWNDDKDPEINWSVAINKEEFDGDGYFAVHISSNCGEGFWEYTDCLDVNELTDLLIKLAEGIEKEESSNMIAQEKTAKQFYEWAVKQDYLDIDYVEETINQMIEDFKLIYYKAPRLYYLLKEISDR